MINSFKVQAQSKQVKIVKIKLKSYEKMPVNTVNQSFSQYNKKLVFNL